MKGCGHELLGCTWLYRRLFLPPVSAPPAAPHDVCIFGADSGNGHMVGRAVWAGRASLGSPCCPRWVGSVVYVPTFPCCNFGDCALLRDQHGTCSRSMVVSVLHLYLQKRNSRRKGEETTGGTKRSGASCCRRRGGGEEKSHSHFWHTIGSAKAAPRTVGGSACATVVGCIGRQSIRLGGCH